MTTNNDQIALAASAGCLLDQVRVGRGLFDRLTFVADDGDPLQLHRRGARSAPVKIENAPERAFSPAPDVHYQVGEVIGASDAAGDRLWRLAFGWAAQAITLSDGRRQVLRLYAPGDLCGALDGGAGELLAVTRVCASPLGDATDLDGSTGLDAGLAALLRQSAREDRRWASHQILRLGRLTALERVGHLLLDLHERAGRGGLTAGATILLPLTQAMLSDVLGLSIPHTERVLQQLRRDGLIALRLGHVTLLDPERLAATSHFTSAHFTSAHFTFAR